MFAVTLMSCPFFLRLTSNMHTYNNMQLEHTKKAQMDKIEKQQKHRKKFTKAYFIKIEDMRREKWHKHANKHFLEMNCFFLQKLDLFFGKNSFLILSSPKLFLNNQTSKKYWNSSWIKLKVCFMYLEKRHPVDAICQ